MKRWTTGITAAILAAALLLGGCTEAPAGLSGGESDGISSTTGASTAAHLRKLQTPSSTRIPTWFWQTLTHISPHSSMFPSATRILQSGTICPFTTLQVQVCSLLTVLLTSTQRTSGSLPSKNKLYIRKGWCKRISLFFVPKGVKQMKKSAQISTRQRVCLPHRPQKYPAQSVQGGFVFMPI